MAINGTARSRGKDIIGMRSIESLERSGLVVQRAADVLAMRAALAETVKLIQKRVSPKEAGPILAKVQSAIQDDAGQRLLDLVMRNGVTIDDVRGMLLGEEAKEPVTA